MEENDSGEVINFEDAVDLVLINLDAVKNFVKFLSTDRKMVLSVLINLMLFSEIYEFTLTEKNAEAVENYDINVEEVDKETLKFKLQFPNSKENEYA